jgi:hypothetical protein
MARRFLIRVYGDSLSLPRVAESVAYHQTYPELLAERWRIAFPDAQVHLYNSSFSGASAPALYQTMRSDAFYFGKPGGDILVVQCGIVDCAPRPLPVWLRALVSRLPNVLRERVVRFLHNHRADLLKLGLSWTVTNRQDFVANMKQCLALAADFDRTYVINIAPTNPEMEAHSPGLSASISDYNRLIEEAVTNANISRMALIDVHDAILKQPQGVNECISKVDGHHLTPAGHRLYARMIQEQEQRYGFGAVVHG